MKNKFLIAIGFGFVVTSFFHLKYTDDPEILSFVTLLSTLFAYLILSGVFGFFKFKKKREFKLHKHLGFDDLINNPPKSIKLTSITDSAMLDERISANDCLVVNTIGVNKDTLDFIPNDVPPNLKEIYCWIWVIRPDLSKDLLKQDISDDLRMLIDAYDEDKMDNYWNKM